MSIFYINCTDPTSRCTTLDRFLGDAIGTCDLSSGRCICPVGYDGNDLLANWNDCHIHIATKTALDWSIMIIEILTFIFVSIGISILLVRWGIVYWNTIREDDLGGLTNSATVHTPLNAFNSSTPGWISSSLVVSDQSMALSSPTPMSIGSDSPKNKPRRMTLQDFLPIVDIGELQQPKANARSTSFQMMVAERKRRRNTLWLLGNMWFFCVYAIVFQAFRLVGVRLEQANGVMLFCLAGVLTTVSWGLWLSTYAWFSNLPSLRLFAAMFPTIKDNFLVRYPQALRNFAILNGTIAFVAAFAIVFVAPMVKPNLVFPVLITGGLLAFAVVVLVFSATHLTVCLLLLKVFALFHDNPLNTKGSSKGFEEGELTVRVMAGLTIFGVIVATALLVSMAFSDIAFRYYYLFFNMLLAVGVAVVICVTFIFVFRMGSKKRVRKASSFNLVPAASRKSFGGGGGESSPGSAVKKSGSSPAL